MCLTSEDRETAGSALRWANKKSNKNAISIDLLVRDFTTRHACMKPILTALTIMRGMIAVARP